MELLLLHIGIVLGRPFKLLATTRKDRPYTETLWNPFSAPEPAAAISRLILPAVLAQIEGRGVGAGF
jgi:hypothetical protein